MRFNFTTLSSFIRNLRQRYKNATGEEACRIAEWLNNQSDTDLKDAFGATQGQITALRNRLKANADARKNLLNKTGE